MRERVRYASVLLGTVVAPAALILGACAADRKPKMAATPPPPAPRVAPAPPMVFPQNTIKVPPAQPVPADAVPPQPPGGLAMAEEPELPPIRTSAARPPVAAAPPRIETPVPATAEIPVTPLPPARAPSTLTSRSDRTRNRAAIEARVRQIRGDLAQLERQNLAGTAKDDRDRATAMIDLAEKALKRGDLRQADDLSGRAAILANALTNSR